MNYLRKVNKGWQTTSHSDDTAHLEGVLHLAIINPLEAANPAYTKDLVFIADALIPGTLMGAELYYEDRVWLITCDQWVDELDRDIIGYDIRVDVVLFDAGI